MNKQTICVGDKIELEHLKSATGRKLSERKYGSKLLDYDGNRIAKIAMPLYEGKIIPLETGDEYTICFFTSAINVFLNMSLAIVLLLFLTIAV